LIPFEGIARWNLTGGTMRISITKAKGRLSELLRRSEAGEDIILTRRGRSVAQLVPAKIAAGDRAARRKLLQSLWGSGRGKASRGPSAARSQDFFLRQARLAEMIAVN